MESGVKLQARFDAGDVQNLLAEAGVLTDKGKPWGRDECRVWLQAVGQRREGVPTVSRERFWETFPEVFERLGMARQAGIAGLSEILAFLHLYAVEILEVGVKFGITASPVVRLAQHSRYAENYGRRLGRMWISGKHAGAAKNERSMKDRYGGCEYLHGANFDDVVTELLALPGVDAGRYANSLEDL